MIDSVSENAATSPDLKHARRRPAAADGGSKLDRLPPNSPEAEQGVLGCVLLSPNECMGICIEKFKPGAEVFYDLRHQTIFSSLAEMYDARQPIDLITLLQQAGPFLEVKALPVRDPLSVTFQMQVQGH